MPRTKSKVKRDPEAPKRNLSAYLLYQNAMRETFKANHPELSFGELSKFTSAMYAQLTPEEKAVWLERAEQDKLRFLREMQTYIPSQGFDQQGAPLENFPQVTGKVKKRDPLAPKRNLSAYLLYQNAMRDQFKADNPGMSFGQLSKYTSHMYKSLSPEEKSEWILRAQRDRERYEEEMKHYTPSYGFDKDGNLLAEFSVPRKNSKTNAKDPHHPKRARGSFLLFTMDERPKILAEQPGVKFTEIGGILGERWRNLSEEERKKYDDLAEQDKLRFTQEMEIYKQSADNERFLQHNHQPIPVQIPVPPAPAPVPLDITQPQEVFYHQPEKLDPHAGYEIYHQEDHHQQYLPEQHHVFQQHLELYHQHVAAPLGPDLLYKDDSHQLIAPEHLVYDQNQMAQLHYEESDIYKSDDVPHPPPTAYYDPNNM